MVKLHILLLLFLSLLGLGSNSNLANAQENTRSLSGEISLDVAPAAGNLVLDVTVRNHSFAVLPPPFGIVRPIQSQVTTQVVIAKGQTTANYSLSGIENDPIDYTIRIDCAGCDDLLKMQFYSPTGNKFGLSNSAFIDPDDLAGELNFEVLTQGSIEGNILISKVASKDLRFALRVLRAESPDETEQSNIVLMAQGTNTIRYQLTDLKRSSSANLLELQCLDCIGLARRAVTFANTLAADTNHQEIDFQLDEQGEIIMAPIIRLLLEEPE